MRRIVRSYLAEGAVAEFVTDCLLFSLAMMVAQWTVRLAAGTEVPDANFPLFAGFAVIGAACNALMGMYRRDAGQLSSMAGYALAAMVVTTLVLFFGLMVLVNGNGRLGAFAPALMPLALLVSIRRPALYVVRGVGVGERRVLIVGAGNEAVSIYEDLQSLKAPNTRLVGFFEAGPTDALAGASLQVFPKSAGLWSIVRRWRVNEVIVAVNEQRGGVLPLRDLLECRIHGVRVMDRTQSYERRRGEFPIESLKASWLIYGHGFEQGLARTAAKRLVDVGGSMVLLLVSLPAMALTALAIHLESPGPVIFRQERIGRGGRPFRVLKFRSMRLDAEKDGIARWATASDSRITRVGRVIRKMRIDELPQLLNVLRGDMSLVGPRPERPTFVETLKEDIRFYDVRHSVKPGLTGWAQVRYCYAASLEDSRRKLQFDLYYVKNHSLWLDLRILLETVRVVLRGEGAH